MYTYISLHTSTGFDPTPWMYLVFRLFFGLFNVPSSHNVLIPQDKAGHPGKTLIIDLDFRANGNLAGFIWVIHDAVVLSIPPLHAPRCSIHESALSATWTPHWFVWDMFRSMSDEFQTEEFCHLEGKGEIDTFEICILRPGTICLLDVSLAYKTTTVPFESQWHGDMQTNSCSMWLEWQ